MMKVLAYLERDDPKYAYPAARLVGIYMGVVRVQVHWWREARAEPSDLEGDWYAPEEREGQSSASPWQAATPTALFWAGIVIISATTD
jgi:hypothetical protein